MCFSAQVSLCMGMRLLVCVEAFEVQLLLWLLSEYISWLKWLKGGILTGQCSVCLCVCSIFSVCGFVVLCSCLL